ncbi:MAG TPA: Ada metal-binding domain-containing protein [Candidatus Sulfotelmatobacter sp.]|nr:Ada metal-binding domain-containing protein [Candidatus Sulfotelmatobacter sp.]
MTMTPEQHTTAGLTTDVAWDAVLKKDRNYDGKFVYAAVTTGIYCRPSCPARNPQRRHTLIFWTTAEAERQGYVACLRCHPNSLTAAEKSIKATLDYIERYLDQTITLTTLSQVSGLSPHHLRETFKHIVGLSPKAYCDARRIARFKQYLRAGHSISSACYEVGFGSSRALYERASKGIGMTPAEYKRGGEGVRIRYTVVDSPLDAMLIASTEDGLCAVLLGEDDEVLLRELRQEFPKADFKNEASIKSKAAVQFSEAEDPLLSKLPMSLRGRILQAKVWHRLTTTVQQNRE